ncbi:MAG: SWIM zinc finger family protein [Candidatus Sericytochromatia bacterium]|nr:SWIM zinc finger family protein [Candidatus Sericytochromatia bacterium]
MSDETLPASPVRPTRRRRTVATKDAASSGGALPPAVLPPIDPSTNGEPAKIRTVRRSRKTASELPAPGPEMASKPEIPAVTPVPEEGTSLLPPKRLRRTRTKASPAELPEASGPTEEVASRQETTAESEAGSEVPLQGRPRRRRRRRPRVRPVAEGESVGVQTREDVGDSEALVREIAGSLRDGTAPASEGSVLPPAGRRRRLRKRRRGKVASALGPEGESSPERPAPAARPVKPGRPERKPHKVSLARRAASMGLGTRRWSERWTDFLEYVGLGPRLKRGLEYARQGAVHDARMDEHGVLSAKVRGSLPEPYRVTFSLLHLEDATWRTALTEMAENAWWSTELLRGELPEDIDEAFAAAGASLYPTDGQEVLAQCTCPDLFNPCKHIAAVFYWLAGQFDKDPFLLFRFRGRTREQVLQALTVIRAGGDPDAETIEEPAIVEDGPLEQRLADFWAMGPGSERLTLQTGLPAQGVGTHLLRLDQPAGWEGRTGFILTMGSYYAALEHAEDLRPFFTAEPSGGGVS